MRPHNKAASCRGVLSNSGSSRRFVYRTADAARSEVGCTPGGQPRELVQSLLSARDHWEQDLTQVSGLVDQVTLDLDAILLKGMRAAVKPLC